MNLRKIAILVLCATLPVMGAALGCDDPIPNFASPTGGPPNHSGGQSGGGGAATVDAGTLAELCQCELAQPTTQCTACTKTSIMPNMGCANASSTCTNDSQCASDAMCIGACIGDAATADPTCVETCLKKASTLYLEYLACTCQACASSCTTTATCP